MKPAPRRFLFATAASVVVASLAAATWYGYDAVASHPVRNVVFAGPTERIPPADLDALARGIRDSGGRQSLAAMREAARRLPWVRDAGVRRRFPDTVEIELETHEPLARWNDDGLVSRRGEVFNAEFDAPLPRFRGNEDAAALVARRYPALAKALAPLESPIAELRLSPRGAWQVRLESGLALELGRGDLEARIARFVSAWPQLAARGVVPKHADLRHANGFALRRDEAPAGARARGRAAT